MKVEQLIEVLSVHAKLLEGVDASAAAKDLVALAKALAPANTAQTKASCEKIATMAQSEIPILAELGGPVVGSALDQLGHLNRLLAAAGAKMNTDIALLVDALGPVSGRPMDWVRASLKPKPQDKKPKAEKIKTTKPKKTGPAVPKRVRTPLDALAIRQLADRLASANGDDQMFKATLTAIKADKPKKAEVFAIANRFLGVEPSRTYESIKVAYQRIEERHFQDANSASRERAITQINH